MRSCFLILVLLVGCGAEVSSEGELVDDAPEAVWTPRPVGADAVAPTLYEQAGGPAPVPVAQPSSGRFEEPPAAPAPEAKPVEPKDAPSDGAGGALPQPPPSADPEPTPEPEPVPEPVVAPEQPERFCKLDAGQRYAGQTLGCTDYYSRTGFPFLTLSWKVSANASAGCGVVDEHPCVTGAVCRARDSRDGVSYSGVCL